MAETFEHMLTHFDAYVAKVGRPNVERSYVASDGCELGKSVAQWRSQANNGKLSAKKQGQLNNAGFQWAASFADRFMHILVTEIDPYVARGIDLNDIKASERTASGFKIGTWLATRRHDHADGRLEPWRQKLLIERGFDLRLRRDQRQLLTATQAIQAITTHLEAGGDLEFSARFVTKEGLPIGRWLQNVRHNPQTSLITRKQRLYLEQLGVFLTPEQRRNRFYRELFNHLQFHFGHGDALVPKSYTCTDSYPLGQKLQYLRVLYREGKLDTRQQRPFIQAGFEFELSRARKDELRIRGGVGPAVFIAAYKAFVAAHPRQRITATTVTSDGYGLGQALGRYRARYQQHAIDPARLKALLDAGVVLD